MTLSALVMRSRRFAIICAALLAAACSDVPTAAPVDAFQSDTASVPLGTWAREYSTVAEWEAAERERVELERMSSAAVLDSLRTVWRTLGGSYEAGNPALLYCSPVPYDADVQVIGPDGGSLTFGPHSLIVPAGALRDTVVITAEVVMSFAVSIRLEPHGLRFLAPAALTLGYGNCNRPPLVWERVAYVDDALKVLEWPRSHDDLRYHRAHAAIEHFSRYAVAY